MNNMRKKLVAGNWKMHGSHTANAELLQGILAARPFMCDVAVCVPFPYLSEVAVALAGSYVSRNLEAAALYGRIVVIALLGGPRADVKMHLILTKRLTLTGSTLRARTVAQKAAVAAAVLKNVWPLLSAGRVRPVIHATFPLAEASAAHRLMETSQHVGKIVLTL